jgi:putative tricarboxylic transport membrane protein
MGKLGMGKRANLRIGLFFLSAALLFAFLLVPTISEDWRQSKIEDVEFFTIGPRFFPYLSAGIMGLLSLLLVFDDLFRKRARTRKAEPPPPQPSLRPVFAFMGIGFGYIAVLPYLGVILATPLCLAVYFWYFEFHRWIWTLLLSIGVTAVIYYCFAKLMMVPLPMGFLER